MKKIGIILAALVITMFFVGAVAAMPANNPPDQREKFREDCAVQGSGYIEYDKIILDKAIAVDVEEHMGGYTGVNGSFAMTIHEVLNEGVRLNCSGTCGDMGTILDPIYGDAHSPVMTNFECKKMVQFEASGRSFVNPNVQFGYLEGIATYANPGFHGGMNAKVTEYYDVTELQKDETVTMTTTATFDDIPRDWAAEVIHGGSGSNVEGDSVLCKKAMPYNANELNFDTKNAFVGTWQTDSSWKKVCSKNIQHHQKFVGEFQVDKNLVFKEEVTKPCPEKVEHGDC